MVGIKSFTDYIHYCIHKSHYQFIMNHLVINVVESKCDKYFTTPQKHLAVVLWHKEAPSGECTELSCAGL